MYFVLYAFVSSFTKLLIADSFRTGGRGRRHVRMKHIPYFGAAVGVSEPHFFPSHIEVLCWRLPRELGAFFRISGVPRCQERRFNAFARLLLHNGRFGLSSGATSTAFRISIMAWFESARLPRSIQPLSKSRDGMLGARSTDFCISPIGP
jgi:hypothetical protein